MLAHAWRVVHSATADPDLVDDACRISARLLVRYWYPNVTISGSLEARCTTAGAEFSDIIRHAYAFLHTLPNPHADWHRDVNAQLKDWPRLPGAQRSGRPVAGQAPKDSRAPPRPPSTDPTTSTKLKATNTKLFFC
jgi:DNA helicase II / ATP-dependent DNA helicase PcrA